MAPVRTVYVRELLGCGPICSAATPRRWTRCRRTGSPPNGLEPLGITIGKRWVLLDLQGEEEGESAPPIQIRLTRISARQGMPDATGTHTAARRPSVRGGKTSAAGRRAISGDVQSMGIRWPRCRSSGAGIEISSTPSL